MNDAQVRENVLDEAKKCVLHDRNSTYGKPEDNFNRIAILWDAYDKIRKPGPETPTDVAIKMTLMKIARLAHNTTHKDSWVDGIGYLACGAGIELAEKLKGFVTTTLPDGSVLETYKLDITLCQPQPTQVHPTQSSSSVSPS